MSVILLPDDHIVGFKASLYPAPNRNASAFGTNEQSFVRPGRRWQFDVDLDRMSAEQVAAYLALEDETGVMALPLIQPGITVGSPGTPLVNGAGQTGMTLNVDGLTPGHAFAARQWISVITSGSRYAYRLRAAVTASGLGVAALPISPMLRVSPANNDVVEIAAPYAEGLASFDGFKDDVGGVAPASFTLRERR